VVVGTAGAVSHSQQQKYANQAAQQQAAAAPATPAPEQSQAAAPAGDDLNSQLMQLSQLHNAGVLSDEEFTQAKAKLLGG
jgi:hypothetical protein